MSRLLLTSVLVLLVHLASAQVQSGAVSATVGSWQMSWSVGQTVQRLPAAKVSQASPMRAGIAQLATDDLGAEQALQIYPNPATQQVYLYYRVPERDRVIRWLLYSPVGKVVWHGEQRPAQARLEIDVHDLPDGIYLLQGQMGTVSFRRKVLITH